MTRTLKNISVKWKQWMFIKHKIMVLHWHTSYEQLQCKRMWLHVLRSLILIVCVDSGIPLPFTFNSKDLEGRIGSRSYLFSWETVFCYYMLTFWVWIMLRRFLDCCWESKAERTGNVESNFLYLRVHSWYYRLFMRKVF